MHAERALAAHAALCRRFERRDGMLRRDGRVHLPGTVAHLWPFARALVATIDLAGIASDVGAEVDPVIRRRLAALERYWDERGPAYASDPPGRPRGGDIYYDDNAWVGLALVGLERLRPGSGRIDRAVQLAAFARGGWAADTAAPHPGGVFWVQQGRGRGARNHDRNTVSTAPNAALILHLQALGAAGVSASEPPSCESMAAWVIGALDAGGDGGGLFWDKITADATIDRARWSYNQGSMIALAALLSDLGEPPWLARAETIAARALDHFRATGYAGEPAEFVAIFVRNLLMLHARTGDGALRARIAATLSERAEVLWPVPQGATLLAHSAVVSLQALAAWDPSDYSRLT
jgi:hypothetical protein